MGWRVWSCHLRSKGRIPAQFADSLLAGDFLFVFGDVVDPPLPTRDGEEGCLCGGIDMDAARAFQPLRSCVRAVKTPIAQDDAFKVATQYLIFKGSQRLRGERVALDMRHGTRLVGEGDTL